MKPVKRTYQLKDIMAWDNELYAAIKDFKWRHGRYPNICCANDATLKVLDVAMTYDLLCDGKVREFKQMSAFAWSKGRVKLAVENKLADAKFQIVYDDKPEFIDDPDGGINLPKRRRRVLMGSKRKKRVPPRR